MKTITEDDLIGHLAHVREGDRHIVAIAGPPGSGKSTLAETLESGLNAKMAGYAAIFQMDGFHYDDLVLVPRGLRPRKGAPETFDVDGFAHMLGRLRSNAEREIAVPVFDRSLEIARAGARVIPQSVRLLIVEGNYLLLDRDGWNSLGFNTTVMLEVPRETVRQRLIERWIQHAKSAEQIALQVDSNDMINVDLVQTASRAADYCIRE
ncbi:MULTISPECIES: nucleoside/nucleotide kinase family protein [unclassified Rhizobium]|uniref:nucleoside triphosphate hydrolase n=1 Tax=unclassified Rhizobium TaxID=2613769 RepID=UPI001ADA25DB|nr:MULTISPECIES: nucleoside triphosphate hydrolase [unclassified Rhizobium]MBO9100843.1 nucleoside triphosphate hydrolase [Rhizobium sp. L58/93]MBO9170471.1 nucleoside triphosphate hydrolase [Rhizobium sp. L245/93]MBO9186396.1 nucleoside triphosphate hydrolase [Rhizobium sp. E27B/91]QXZ86283.1 nucleoside triphosphate hydrolase [Rhizobium sp. K1/93]QXZ92262.1 nucleoside triphosphate hydrolase [Rhizobium sp. K15/93]